MDEHGSEYSLSFGFKSYCGQGPMMASGDVVLGVSAAEKSPPPILPYMVLPSGPPQSGTCGTMHSEIRSVCDVISVTFDRRFGGTIGSVYWAPPFAGPATLAPNAPIRALLSMVFKMAMIAAGV